MFRLNMCVMAIKSSVVYIYIYTSMYVHRTTTSTALSANQSSATYTLRNIGIAEIWTGDLPICIHSRATFGKCLKGTQTLSRYFKGNWKITQYQDRPGLPCEASALMRAAHSRKRKQSWIVLFIANDSTFVWFSPPWLTPKYSTRFQIYGQKPCLNRR
jgi:hypothetical protein